VIELASRNPAIAFACGNAFGLAQGRKGPGCGCVGIAFADLLMFMQLSNGAVRQQYSYSFAVSDGYCVVIPQARSTQKFVYVFPATYQAMDIAGVSLLPTRCMSTPSVEKSASSS